MELVLDENGFAKLEDGKPVYRYPDGKEVAFDAARTVAKIGQLNAEAKSHRERAEAFERALQPYEGLDPAAARQAVETVSKISDKKLIDAGKVDEVKAEAERAYQAQLKQIEEKYAPIAKERDTLQAALVAEKIGGSFLRSKYIADKLAIPADLAQAAFGSAFKLEDGGVVGYDRTGNRLFSRERPGELASFDEALSMLVEQYPHRDQIMKSTGASGSGAAGSGNNAGVKSKSLTRSEFDALPPTERMAFIKSGGRPTDD